MFPILQLSEEIKAILIERVKNSREELLRMYYDIGETLRRYEKEGTNITVAVWQLKELMSDTSLWFSLKLYDTYSTNFEQIYGTEDGLNTSVEKQKKLLGFRTKEKDTSTTCKKCPLHCSKS